MTYKQQCNYYAKLNRDQTDEGLLAFYYSWVDYIRKLKTYTDRTIEIPSKKFLTEKQRQEELRRLKMI